MTTLAVTVAWWIAAVKAHGLNVTDRDLNTAFSSDLRATHPVLAAAEAFRANTTRSVWSDATNIEMVDRGDTIDVHFVRWDEAHVATVTGTADGQIADVRYLLADGTSFTAINVTIGRALHHRLAKRPVFDDPLAELIGGPYVQRAVDQTLAAEQVGRPPIMPLARVRFTEDELSLAYAQGCEQYVLLGAGLDTFAYRSPLASHLDVYELDTRETQAGKLRRAAAAGIGPIGKVRHAAIDFEHERLDSTLIAHGLDPQRATFVAWLGVSYYLTDEAIRSTLAAITRLSGVKWMTLDYFRPRTTWDEAMHAGATRAALTREPWITTFDDAMIDALLTDHGFGVGDRIDGPEAAARYPTDVELVPTVATSSVLARRHQ